MVSCAKEVEVRHVGDVGHPVVLRVVEVERAETVEPAHVLHATVGEPSAESDMAFLQCA